MGLNIKRLSIHSYGKLQDRTLHFSDGLNVVVGENEAGKSTTMSMIKALLYGFGDNRGDITKNDRRRYTPWDGSTMSGEMEFTLGDRSYLLSRSAGKTKASDSCSLIDTETGKVCEIPPESLLGIGAEGFEKTVYIRQLGSEISSDDEVLSKLTNLAESGEADASASGGLAQLDKAKAKLIAKRGKSGQIQRTEEALFRLKQELATKIEEINARAESEQRLAVLRQESEVVNAQIADSDHALRNIQKFVLYNEYHALSEEEAEQNASFISANAMYQEAVALRDEKAIFKDSPIALPPASDTTATMELERRMLSEKKKTHTALVLLSLFFVLSGILLGLLVSPLCYLLSAIGLIGTVFGMLSKQKLSIRETELLEAEEKAKQSTDTRNAFLASYGVKTAEEYLTKRAAYQEAEGNVRLASERKAEAENALQKAKEKREAKEQEIMRNYGMLESIGKTELCSDTVLEEKEKAEQKKSKLAGEITRLETLLHTESERTMDTISAEIAQTEEILSELQTTYQALELAEASLSQAFDELSRNFAPQLNRRASQILAELTDQKHTDVFLDKEYHISLHDDSVKELAYFSGGTKDQVYFALRLATAELLFPSESLPLILDDPFVQYDDARMDRAYRFLQEYGASRQIILFTARTPKEMKNIPLILL